MSNNQFWSRYFFKVNQLEEDYKKRVQLLEKAGRTTTMEATSNKEESNDWEDGNITIFLLLLIKIETDFFIFFR